MCDLAEGGPSLLDETKSSEGSGIVLGGPDHRSGLQISQSRQVKLIRVRLL